MKVKQIKILLFIATGVLFSCGKKVENSDPTREAKTYQRPNDIVIQQPVEEDVIIADERENNIDLSVTFLESDSIQDQDFFFNSEAWVVIPEKINVLSGKPSNFITRVYFNSDNSMLFSSENSELFCEYSNIRKIGSSDKEEYYHKFVGCFEDVDLDGIPDEINYFPGDLIPQNSGKYIRLKFVEGFSAKEAEVYTNLLIEWY